MSAGPLQVEAKLIEANVTEEQLADANEPEFSGALDARREVREHAETDPADYRAQEEARARRAGAPRPRASPARSWRACTAPGSRPLGKVGRREGRHEERRPAGARGGPRRAPRHPHAHRGRREDDPRDARHDGRHHLHLGREDRPRRLRDLRRPRRCARTRPTATAACWRRHTLAQGQALRPPRRGQRLLPRRARELPRRDGPRDRRDRHARRHAARSRQAADRGRAARRSAPSSPASTSRCERSASETAADLDNRFDQLDSDVDAKRDELVDTVARKYVESRDDLDCAHQGAAGGQQGLGLQGDRRDRRRSSRRSTSSASCCCASC